MCNFLLCSFMGPENLRWWLWVLWALLFISTYNMQGPNIKPNFLLKKLPAAMVFKILFFWYLGVLVHVDLGAAQCRLGGTAFAQCYKQLGNASPDLDHPDVFSKAFTVTQLLIKGDVSFIMCIFLKTLLNQISTQCAYLSKFFTTSWEPSGSVVESLTRDRWAAGLSLTGVTVLWSLSKTHLSLLGTGSTQEDPFLFN